MEAAIYVKLPPRWGNVAIDRHDLGGTVVRQNKRQIVCRVTGPQIETLLADAKRSANYENGNRIFYSSARRGITLLREAKRGLALMIRDGQPCEDLDPMEMCATVVAVLQDSTEPLPVNNPEVIEWYKSHSGDEIKVQFQLARKVQEAQR